MIKKSTKPTLWLCLALCFTSPVALGAVSANKMQDIINSLFDKDYSNATAAGHYETQRANTYSGGSYTERNHIVNLQLAGLDPFYISSGCGGIDIYGGSLSFIKGSELQALFEQIMKNAKGYAFNIALESLCPQCMASLNNLQSKIQKLAQANINSCEMAQGIVTDAASALANKKFTMDNTKAVLLDGVAEDYQAVKKAGDSTVKVFKAARDKWRNRPQENTPAAQETTKQLKKEVTKYIGGALTYVAIVDSAPNWFALKPNAKVPDAQGKITTQTLSTNDSVTMAELVLSFTGSLVLSKPETKQKDGLNQTAQKRTELPPIIKLRDIVEGSGNETIKVYNCSAGQVEGLDICAIAPNQTNEISVKGYETLLYETLNTFIDQAKADQDLDALTEQWLGSLDFDTISNVQTLLAQAKFEPEAARDYVRRATKNIAYMATKKMLMDVFNNTERLIAADSEQVFQEENKKIIAAARKQLEEEYDLAYKPENDPKRVYDLLIKHLTQPKD